MRRLDRRWLLGIALLVALVGLLLAASLAGPGEAQGSSAARGPGGWLAARKYLEARGAEVTLWRQPLDRFSGGGVLVVAFPWQHGLSLDTADHLEAHLRRGGNLVVAWSGSNRNLAERLALEGLGLSPSEVREAPLNPVAWRRFTREEWDLRPVARGPDHAAVRVWAPRSTPDLPQNAEVLYRDPEGRPAVARVPRYRGALWVLPADALANARLGDAGNADLLETLLARLGPQWTFDEYHHGLIEVQTEEGEAFGRILDLVLLHLALLYGLAVLSLARRFGPPWRETPVTTGSVSSFLLGLGTLHHRLGHHAAAAQRLLERVREISPDLQLPEDLARRAATAGPRDLVAVARAVVRLRRGRSAIQPGDRE